MTRTIQNIIVVIMKIKNSTIINNRSDSTIDVSITKGIHEDCIIKFILLRLHKIIKYHRNKK